MPLAVILLLDRVGGEKGLGPGGDRGAGGVIQARAIVTVFSGSSGVSPTRATSVVNSSRNRVDAFRSPERYLYPGAATGAGPKSWLAWGR